MKPPRRRLPVPSPAMAVALVALVVAAGGTATAATLITSSQIKDGTVRGADVRDGSITRADLSKATVRALRGRRGPQGLRGATGAPGVAVAASTSGATAFVAGSQGQLPSCSSCEVSLAPSGVSNFGSVMNASNRVLSPNAALVGRDLRVSVEVPPGTGKTRMFFLSTLPFDQANRLTCSIADSATTCDSGAQTMALPPGSALVMDAANIGSAPASNVIFGWQASSP